MFGLVNYSIAQNNVITEVWLENTGVQSGVFGSPTAVDAADNVYRAGFENQSNGGAIAKLQKIDNEGQLLWTVNLTSTTVDKYEPSKVVTNGSNIYVTGIVTYQSTGQSDFFISKISQSGTLQWLSIDQATGNDVASDLVYDATSSTIYLCGTTERAGSYDMLLASYADNGTQNWLAQRDYTGLADLGAKVFLDGANIVVQGSSQSTTTDWDITSWFYDDGGNYISEQHSGGLNAASDELRDGALNNGFIHLTGVSRSGANYKFKVVCLDATNNILWEDTYDKNTLREEGTALVATSSGFVAAGFVTTAAGNEDILIRKYDLSGNALWTREIDVDGANDRGVDIAEDAQGNYIVVSDVEVNGQTDVYMHYIEASTGNELWATAVAQDGAAEEKVQSIEVTFGGEMYITYQTEGQAATEAYSYSDVDFPMDNEPFSRGSLIIRNSGQLRNDSGEVVTDVRYYTFGLHPEMYYADQRMSALVLDDDTSTNQVQRIDFDFVNANSTHVGEVTEHERESHFNYYKGADKYEQQSTFDVLAYPELYANVDAFVSSNSSGFKMTFVLESGADLDDIELDINGSSGFALSGANLEVSTIADPISWLEPYSYPKSDVEKANDGCLQYVLSGGHLKLISGCGELSYPYVITLRAGVGATYGVSAIDNMDWSTYFGGNGCDGGNAVTVDKDANIFIGGFSESNQFPSNPHLSSSPSSFEPKGLILKFIHDTGELLWATFLDDRTEVKEIGVYDNLASAIAGTEEVHVVGKVENEVTPFNYTLVNPYSYYEQGYDWDPGTPNDLFIATLDNINGGVSFYTAFGGDGQEDLMSMDISASGKLYFCGSTDKGGHATYQSQTGSPYGKFPVYNPNDNSYYQNLHPAPGAMRGFVAAIDLNNYKLQYSTILPDFKVLYDIEVGNYPAYCGEGLTNAKLGFFNGSQMFASSLTQSFSDYNNLTYFSSVVSTNNGNVFFGMNESSSNSLQTTSMVSTDYQVSAGEAYLLRFEGSNSALTWDTYFGQTADQKGFWRGTQNQSNFHAHNHVGVNPEGRGRLAYNNLYSTVFAFGTEDMNPVETHAKPGYFTESVINNGAGYFKTKYYLSAFSDNAFNKNNFSWGTIFGGNRQEYSGGLVTYHHNGKSYVIVTGLTYTSFTRSYSDPNYFPVSDLGYTQSWFQDINYLFTQPYPPNSKLHSEISITRFEVSGINEVLSEAEVELDTRVIGVYPNPTKSNFKILCKDPDSHFKSVKVYDVAGKCIIDRDNINSENNSYDVDLANFPNGSYFITINGSYNAKVIKI